MGTQSGGLGVVPCSSEHRGVQRHGSGLYPLYMLLAEFDPDQTATAVHGRCTDVVLVGLIVGMHRARTVAITAL
jgi:hypothetical protein